MIFIELTLFKPIEQRVSIQQKTVRHSPIEKLYDALIGLLCGAQGMVETNKRVRPDKGLQKKDVYHIAELPGIHLY